MNEAIEFFIFSLILFLIIISLFKLVYRYLKSNSHIRILNVEEYLPVEEIQTLKQVSYLIMMTLFVIDIFYQFTFQTNDLIFFAVFDIIISLFAICLIKYENIKSAILAFALMPFISFDYLVLDSSELFLWILLIIHFIALVYMVLYFYRRFKRYTKSNGLSYSILMLFGIIFFSFIWTAFVEEVSLLDSLIMVSNAFTSNGYAILGTTIAGKINGLFLVWAGYVLSGVGTATLTLALITRYYNKKFDELKEMIEELKEEKESK